APMSTPALIPTGAKPWIWAAVALVPKPEKDPLKVTAPVAMLSVALHDPVAVLALVGTSCAPFIAPHRAPAGQPAWRLEYSWTTLPGCEASSTQRRYESATPSAVHL